VYSGLYVQISKRYFSDSEIMEVQEEAEWERRWLMQQWLGH